ncbi:ABC1 kinase family protein [Parvicella tangerina]|uniref:Protein kinase UbiB n=1 Tax=Parvicella tangerina TaxID=2829795 RepID=A0A916JJ79_9FLAO|nr:AarF/ABC1/UbiB kinase family protein [Parvicella tangerina]CAG5076588.1 protein kinase UbiB [Parvicella tangerina]
MKEQKKIPTSKVQRAAKLFTTGAKMGGNYVKYIAKTVAGDEKAREQLDEDNANDIYESLSELKGSALKVAQIMSMDKNMLPQAMQDKFSLAQYSAPPLSYPLVVKTFRQFFGKSPDQLFDTFTKTAVNAASIGQVHKATLGDKTLAVKVQYPGVADSVQSDLKMVKPIAMKILGLREGEVKQYFEEVESKLMEETDYEHELKQSIEIAEASRDLEGFVFPKYYPEYSSKRVLTMDWLDGMHLKEFLKTNPSQELRNQIGQRLWRLYDFQVNELKAIHADPHPGNFLIQQNGTVGLIDFGCVKRIPEDFYKKYFQLINSSVVSDDAKLRELFFDLEFIFRDEPKEVQDLFFEVFKSSMELLIRPFMAESFDFSNQSYFDELYAMGEELKSRKDIRKNGVARGSRHILYINRTYFGLFALLNELGATIETKTSFEFSE